MAKKSNPPVTDLQKYKNATAEVARLTDQIKQLKKQIDELNAPSADPFANLLGTAGLEQAVKDTEVQLQTTLKIQTQFVKAHEDEIFRIKEAELQKEGALERSLLQKLLADKAKEEARSLAEQQKAEAVAAKEAEKAAKEKEKANKAAWAEQAAAMKANFEEEQKLNQQKAKEAEKAAKETAKTLADVRKQAEADDAAAEKMRKDQYAAAAKAMKEYQKEEEAERKKAEKDKAATLARELKEIRDADAKKAESSRAAVEQFRGIMAMFEAGKAGGFSGLAKMGLNAFVESMLAPSKSSSGKTTGGKSTGAKATDMVAGAGGDAAGDVTGGAEKGAEVGAQAGPEGAAIGAIIGAAIGAATALKDLAIKAYNLSVQLSSLVAPGVTARHERATEDMWASIGVMLLPIVEHATNVLDRFNELFTSLQGRVTPVVEKLAMALEKVFDATVTISQMLLEEFGPGIDLVCNHLMKMVDIFVEMVAAFVRGTAIMIEFFDRVARGDFAGAADIAGIVRAAEERAANLPNARTIAARQAQFTTVEGIGEAARLAAFSARATATQQLDETRRQTGLLQTLVNNTRPGGGDGAPTGGTTGVGGGILTAPFRGAVQIGQRIGEFIW